MKKKKREIGKRDRPNLMTRLFSLRIAVNLGQCQLTQVSTVLVLEKKFTSSGSKYVRTCSPMVVVEFFSDRPQPSVS